MANLPTRNNNPGDLKNPATGQFDQFSDPASGFAALKSDLSAKISGNTKTGLGPQSNLQDLASVWAPASDGNNPTQYASTLAQKLKVAPTAPLASLNVDDLAMAISGAEGYQGPSSDSSQPAGQSSGQLSHSQLIENINAMEKQGAKPEEIQSYLDSLKQGGAQNSGDVSASALSANQNASGVPITPLNIPDGTDGSATPQKPGIMSELEQGNFAGAAGDAVKGVGNFLFPSVGDVYHDIKGDSTKTGLQQLGDAGSTALGIGTLIPGLDVFAGAGEAAKAAESATDVAKATPGLLSTVGKNAALGAGFGTTQALGAGATSPTQIAEGTAAGAVSGGLIGGAGGLISKAADTLPQRLVQGVIKNSNPDVAQYALTRPLGSPAKMLSDSDASIKDLGSQLGQKLKDEGIADRKVSLGDLLPEIQKQYPDAEITADSLKDSIGKIAPLKKALITKLTEGDGLTMDELNNLKSEVGGNVYKTVFDDPTVKAGKQIGNAFYQAAKSKIIAAAPDTESLFDQLSKEYQLNGALGKTVARGSKTQALTLKDIMALLGGFSALGPLGAAGAYGLEKAATSPTVNLKAAGLLSKLSPRVISGAAKAATLGTSGLLGRVVGKN